MRGLGAMTPTCEFCELELFENCDCARFCSVCKVAHPPSAACDPDDLINAELEDLLD
jgi:hypothetical protein